jgi:hypothetical protein
VLLLGGVLKHSGGPHLGGKEGVGLGQSLVDGNGKISSGAGVSSGGRVHVLDTSHVQQLLGDKGSHDTRSTGSGDEAHTDGTALAGDLAGHSVGSALVVSPVSSAHRDAVHLGVDDGTANSSGDLLGSLKSKTEVSVSVADGNVGLKSGALTSGGLLLHGHDLHNLVAESRAEEVIDDLVLLDGEREKEDLLNGLDSAILDKAAELGHWDPLFLLLAHCSTTTTTTTTTATA